MSVEYDVNTNVNSVQEMGGLWATRPEQYYVYPRLHKTSQSRAIKMNSYNTYTYILHK